MEVRSIGLTGAGLYNRPGSTVALFPYDTSLLTLARSAPRSIPDVVQVLESIDATCVDGDGLKWFNRLYLQVTKAVQDRVDAGGFRNPAFLRELDVQFAKLYFDALAATLHGESCAACWTVMLTVRTNTRIARIQFALAGVNAHINHDLPEALVTTMRAIGTVPSVASPEHVVNRARVRVGILPASSRSRQ